MCKGCQSSTSDYLPCWVPLLVNSISSLAHSSLWTGRQRLWKQNWPFPSYPQGRYGRGHSCERGAGTSSSACFAFGQEGRDRAESGQGRVASSLCARASAGVFVMESWDCRYMPQSPIPMWCHLLLPMWLQIVINLFEPQFFSSSKWG